MNSFFQKKRINASSKMEIEPHEIFLDRLAQEREEEFNQKIEVPIVKRKFFVLKIIFLFLFLVLLGKTFQFQIYENSKFEELARNNRERIYQIQAPRGIIYDRNMKQLVFNKPAYDLVCDKRDLSKNPLERLEKIETVASIIKEDPETLQARIEEEDFPLVLVSENLTHETLIVLEAKINELFGFQIKENTIREYTDKNLSHVLGYTGKVTRDDLNNNPNYFITDYIGRSGIEQYYEEVLRGESGRLMIEKNALGDEMSRNLISQVEDGKNLVSNLDSALQTKLTQELKASLKRVGANSAAAVAIDPRGGEILSLVSLPEFDNNLFSQGFTSEQWKDISDDEKKPLFNRAMSGFGYPTGSVIKPLIGIAALEEGIISEYTKIYCPLEICVWNRYLEKDECFEDWTFHGLSDIKRAIAESVNTFFYIVGGGYENFKGLGAEKIIKYLSLFNWGKGTGIDLPQEGKGILPEIGDSWRLGHTYHLSIGQGPFTATPIEVATAFAAIANRGKLYEPHIVKEIVDSSDNSKVIKEITPKIIRENFIDSENIETIREGMRQTVTAGSAVSLNSLAVTSAAKTGTAESSKEGHYHHWICVFAPYENPEIVLTVVIEDIEGVKSATLPVVKEVLQWYFSER